MNIAFLAVIVVIFGGNLLALSLLKHDPDIKRPLIKFIVAISLVSWTFPLLGFFNSGIIGTIGRKNFKTSLGKIYTLISVVLFFASFFLYIDNVGTLLQMQYE